VLNYDTRSVTRWSSQRLRALDARWAVSLGMVAEARLARQLRLADASTVERQERLLTAVGLPTRAKASTSTAC